MPPPESAFFTTSDGVRLHYLTAGTGPALVLMPVENVAAELFGGQLAGLCDSFHCLALDPRGHGMSDKPTFGYRLARLAKDCLELLDHLGIEQAVLLGHSASCAVIWSLLDTFGDDRVRAIVLCDQMIARLQRVEWTAEETRNYGAEITGDALMQQAEVVGGPQGEAATRAFLTSMFTPDFPAERLYDVIKQSLQMPRPQAAEWLLAVSFADFRDLLPRIRRPTLCIGGTASHLAHAMPWLAAQIPAAELVMIETGGSHFMFLENPAEFNTAVRDFLKRVL